MRTIGISRPIDELGRIVIPMEYRKALDIHAKDALEITLVDNTIKLKKYERSCVLCGAEGDHMDFNDRIICLDCLKKLRSI